MVYFVPGNVSGVNYELYHLRQSLHSPGVPLGGEALLVLVRIGVSVRRLQRSRHHVCARQRSRNFRKSPKLLRWGHCSAGGFVVRTTVQTVPVVWILLNHVFPRSLRLLHIPDHPHQSCTEILNYAEVTAVTVIRQQAVSEKTKSLFQYLFLGIINTVALSLSIVITTLFLHLQQVIFHVEAAKCCLRVGCRPQRARLWIYIYVAQVWRQGRERCLKIHSRTFHLYEAATIIVLGSRAELPRAIPMTIRRLLANFSTNPLRGSQHGLDLNSQWPQWWVATGSLRCASKLTFCAKRSIAEVNIFKNN